MILRWMALPLAALAFAVVSDAAPLKMWDGVTNTPFESIRPDVAGPDARAELRADADDRGAGHLVPLDPVVDPAFEPVLSLLRAEALPINSGSVASGTSTLPVPEATTLVFVGLALAGAASGRKLFKR